MTDKQIILGAVIYCAAAIGLVVSQYHAPQNLRPLTIVKRAIMEVVRMLKSARQRHSAMLSEDLRRAKEEDERQREFRGRPCERCGAVGRFRIIDENRLISQKTSGEIMIQIALVLFIITPLTCGLGIICLLFVNSGKRYQRFISQECIACGFIRPYR
jgi:hypothetical protein